MPRNKQECLDRVDVKEFQFGGGNDSSITMNLSVYIIPSCVPTACTLQRQELSFEREPIDLNGFYPGEVGASKCHCCRRYFLKGQSDCSEPFPSPEP